MMSIGDFQKLPPVGDSPIHGEGGYDNILFESIEYVVQLVGSHRNLQKEDDNDPAQRYSQHCLINCQQGTIYEQYWRKLQSRFMQTDDDTSDPSWDNVPHILFDNKNQF